jgi:type I restriction enzyme, S subunit
MRPERLLQHFDAISDAPDAVAKLRRLVMRLAVQGKLLEEDGAKQRPKTRGTQAGPFLIPPAWSWQPLAALGNLKGGGTPSKAREDFWGGGVPWVSPKDMKSDYISDSQLSITPAAVEGSSVSLVAPGSLLFVVRGMILAHSFPVAIATRAVTINQDMKALELANPEWNEYLLRALKALRPEMLARVQRSSHGTGRLDATAYRDFVVPIPPLAEQDRIVAKVDELMALCDQLDAARTRREATRDRLAAASLARLNTPDPDALRNDARLALDALHASLVRSDQIKHLRQTVLDLAVRGALVPQTSVKTDVDRLLARVEAAKSIVRAAEGLRERPPVRTLRRDELPFTFPDAWGLSCFDRLFVIVSGVTKGQRVDKNNAVDVPYLRVANVQRGYLELSIMKTISVRRADENRFSLRSGDILMTEGGDWDKLGRAAIWRNEIPGCIHQNHVFRVRCASADVLPEWVVMFVNSPLGRSLFADAAKQTTNLASINMTQLRGCPLPIPDTDEQHRIVARVDELMTLCDQLETALTRAETTRHRLLDALLHESLAPALEAAA